MPNIRILRLCQNPVVALNIALMSGLRTLFIDGARLEAISHMGTLRKLENVSLRDQAGGCLCV